MSECCNLVSPHSIKTLNLIRSLIHFTPVSPPHLSSRCSYPKHPQFPTIPSPLTRYTRPINFSTYLVSGLNA